MNGIKSYGKITFQKLSLIKYKKCLMKVSHVTMMTMMTMTMMMMMMMMSDKRRENFQC